MKLSNTASALLISATATLSHAIDAPASTPADPTPADDTFAAATSLPASNTNTNFYWSPLSTLAPSTTTPPSLQDHLSSILYHDILRRQGAPVTAPAAATVEGQVSPVTTIMENQIVNGVEQQVQVVYTQLFSAVPDQGDAPASGSIGLGTIQGEIGVMKTNVKREVQATAMAVAEVAKREEVVVEGELERREEKRQVVRRESMAGKTMEAMSAGSALALLVAITAMVVV